MKVQVLDDAGAVMFENDTNSPALETLPSWTDRPTVAAALAVAAKIASSDVHVVASIKADIQAVVTRIETELGAHPAFTWAQTKLKNAGAHLEQYAAGVWTEPPVVQGVTVDARGVVLSVAPPPAPPEDPDHARR